MSRARRVRTSPRTSFSRTTAVLISALAVAALVAPTVPAVAADPVAITPVQLLGGPQNQVIDPLGSPNASSLVVADTVLTTGGSLRSAAQASADLASATSTGSATGVVGLPDLTPQFATASGRFTDDGAERALALRLGDLQGAAVLNLASTSAALEGQTRAAKLTAMPEAGATLQIAACGAQPCQTKNFLAVDTKQPAGLGGAAIPVADPGGAGAPQLEWSLRGSDGNFQIVNSLTGLCLTARDGNAVTSPCGAAIGQPNSPIEQTWTITVGAGGVVTTLRTQVAGVRSSLYLDVDGVFRVTATIPAAAEDVFSLLLVQQSGGVVPTWSTPNLARDAGLGFDLATGDLDRAVVNNGYRDEAAVAYIDAVGKVHVAIIDYGRAEGMQVTDLIVAYAQGSVTAEIGDFNGDGSNEIAVMVYTNEEGLRQEFVQYTAPGEAKSLAGGIVNGSGGQATRLAGGMTTAAGDFTGTGHDALAVAYIASGGGDLVEVMVNAFSGDGFDRTGSTIFNTELSATVTTEQGRFISRGPRLVAALLASDASSGAPTGRRQLVVAVPTQAGTSCYQALQADQPAGGALAVTSLGTPYCAGAVTSTTSGDAGNAFAPIQLAAGGFAGRNAESGSLPQWGVATLVGPSPTSPHLTMLSLTAGALVAHDLGETSGSTDSTVTLTAFDQKNETLRLGAPLIVNLENIQTPTMIAAAPPAHVDWIYDASAGKDAFVNISAKPDLAIAMSDSDTKSFASTTETKFGGSSSISAKASVTETVGMDVKVFKAKVSAEFSVHASATVAGADTKASENASTKTTTVRSRTVSDDIVRVKVASQRIYRYPVIGGRVSTDDASCGDACHTFYDVYVPTSQAFVQTDAGGRTLDRYAPPWVNGNLLSYPTNRIEAPGEWSYVDDSGKTIIKTEDILQQRTTLDGASSNTTLQLTSIDNSSHKSEASGTFQQGVGMKTTAKASFDLGGVSEGTSATAEATLDVSESFAHTSTGKTSTTSSSGFELMVPAVAHGGYAFTTFYYYIGGVSKVNYSVDPLAVDKGWWNTNYGSAPDPALALPFAVELDEGKTPQFATELRRQQIRGFRALQATEGVALQDLPDFTSAPRVGEKVRFAVDVHNYSLAPSVDTSVEFFAVPVNPGTLKPVGPSQPIGDAVTVSALAAQGNTVAYSPEWTAALPAVADPTSTWNIFVVLNRAGSAPEIHPYKPETGDEAHNLACPTTRANSNFARASIGTVDKDGFRLDPLSGERDVTACGQNNQGYGTVSVLPAKQSLRAADEAEPEEPANVELEGAGFVTADEATTALTEVSPVPTVIEGVATQSFVKLMTDRDSDEHQLVMVWDGDPDQGGELIASTTLQGASAETGGYAPFSWMPTGVGEHKLYQKVFGNSDAGPSDAQIVTVNVVAQPVDPGGESPAPTTSPSTSASPSSGASETPDATDAPTAGRPGGSLSNTGGLVPIFALIFGAAALIVGGSIVGSRALSRRRRGL